MANVLVVSDLHCGSIFGMLPPDFETSDGCPKIQNSGQKYLWKCWDALPARLKPLGKVDAVVVNGDPIDGRQDAQRGTELALPLMVDQVRAAEETLRHLLKLLGNPPIYFVQGTEYHDGKGGEHVEHLARALGAVKYRHVGTGVYSGEVLDLEIDGVVIDFAHGIGVSAGLYRATPPDREGVWSALAGKEGKFPKADCVVRAHAHYFIHVEHYSKHVFINPCWQLQTRYMRKNGPYRMVPDIGASLISIDPQAKKDGIDPIDVHKFLFPLPPITTTKLERL